MERPPRLGPACEAASSCAWLSSGMAEVGVWQSQPSDVCQRGQCCHRLSHGYACTLVLSPEAGPRRPPSLTTSSGLAATCRRSEKPLRRTVSLGERGERGDDLAALPSWASRVQARAAHLRRSAARRATAGITDLLVCGHGLPQAPYRGFQRFGAPFKRYFRCLRRGNGAVCSLPPAPPLPHPPWPITARQPGSPAPAYLAGLPVPRPAGEEHVRVTGWQL